MIQLEPPNIFNQFPNILAGLSHDAFDDAGAQTLGFKRIIVQHQVHGDTINETEQGLEPTSGDALITHQLGWLIGMRVADCATILLYDPEHSVVAAIHSGWRGSKLDIVSKTITRLVDQFGSKPKNIWGYVSPLAQKCCYEVLPDFQANFASKFFETRDDKLYFNNQAIIQDQLSTVGIPASQLELDPRCTIHDQSLQSYRRDGDRAGRMLVVIGLK